MHDLTAKLITEVAAARAAVLASYARLWHGSDDDDAAARLERTANPSDDDRPDALAAAEGDPG